MFGTLQSCAVSGDIVPSGGSDQGKGGHAIGVHIVAIMMNSVGETVTIGPVPWHAGHAPVGDDAPIDAHTITIVTVCALMSVACYTIKQSSRASDKLWFQWR